jgi:DnaJ-class molecular chaperone
VLANPHFREIYDLEGESALKKVQNKSNAQVIVHEIEVTLKELYHNTTHSISYTRLSKCVDCDGRGT